MSTTRSGAKARTEMNEIAGQARIAFGDDAVKASTRGYLWSIQCPPCDRDDCSHRVRLHSSPSDVNWKRVARRELDAHGFSQQLAKRQDEAEAKRQAAIEADRRAAEVKAEAQAKKAALHAAALTRAAGKHAVTRVDLDWLTTPHELEENRKVIVYPDDAQTILDYHNPLNRPESPGSCDYFCALMRAGEFAATNQAGAFDTKGRLQDGQTRLKAIIKTGLPQEMYWFVGMPEENFDKLDSGRARTGGQAVYVTMLKAGKPISSSDANSISVAAKMLLVHKEFGANAHVPGGHGKIANSVVDAAVLHYGEPLFEALKTAKDIRKSVGTQLNLPALTVAVYLISTRLPGDPRPGLFFADLRDGAMVSSNDPVKQLRDRVLRATNWPRKSWEQLANLLLCWNNRASGTKRNPVWTSVQNFPEVVLPGPLEEDAHMQRRLVAA